MLKIKDMVGKPRASIIIPTKNRAGDLAHCLKSLSEQTYGSFEVIVVDGGSTDKTREVVKTYATRLLIKFVTQSGGLVRQQNKGLEHSNGEILIRIDDDIVANPEWLSAIIESFQNSSDVGGVTGPTIIPTKRRANRDLFYFQNKFMQGGKMWRLIGNIYFNYFMEGEPFAIGKWFRCGAFSLGSNYPQCLNLKEPIEVSNLEACNMAIKRELLKRTGGFDETFAGIGEYNEADMAFKIKRLGYKLIFNPRAVVYHLPSRSGLFRERPNSYGRVLNFINFYFRHIKPNTVDKARRFYLYLLFLNGFFVYKAISTGKLNQLGCVAGTITGLTRNIVRRITEAE